VRSAVRVDRVSDGVRVELGRTARVKVPHPLVVRRLHVVATARVTPTIARVTLAGAELAGFVSTGPADHVKAFFPDPVTRRLAAPTIGIDGALHPPQGPAYPRDYTPRAFRDRGASGLPELDLDLVLHDDDGGGPAAAWAARAEVGDPLVVLGPRSSALVPAGADAFVLLCDETALPAVARWLELVPGGASVRVLAEYSAPGDDAYLGETGPGVQVDWLRREGPAGTSDVLERAVRALGPLPAGTYVWAGGEAGSLVGVRRHLRRGLGLAAERFKVSGYWRRGVADFDHHAPIDPTDPD